MQVKLKNKKNPNNINKEWQWWIKSKVLTSPMRVCIWKKWFSRIHARNGSIELRCIVLQKIHIDVFLFLLFKVLEKVIFSTIINYVVNHAGCQLHSNQLKNEAKDLSEKCIPCKDICTVSIAWWKVICIEVPQEHYKRANKVAGN